MNSAIYKEKSKVLKEIKSLAISCKLVSKKKLLDLLNEVNFILQNEITFFRSAVSEIDSIPGGLLDFSANSTSNGELNGAIDFGNADSIFTIVVPDLHARKELIYNLLNYKIDDKSVFELLCQNKVKIIFLGDILHSEGNQKQRWLFAYEEYEKGNSLSNAMTEEMIDGLSTLLQVVKLKITFPSSVHCLKGNHENIKNETGNGNYAFHKFVHEGSMVLDFILDKYGKKVLHSISEFENLLPIAAFFDNFILSHAEPCRYFTREEIIDCVLDSSVIEGLTWTKNDDAEDGCVQKMLKANCQKNEVLKKYITGHRPIKGSYGLRQDGFLVQIHNPRKMQFACIENNKGFNPDFDIFEL